MKKRRGMVIMTDRKEEANFTRELDIDLSSLAMNATLVK